MSLPFEPTWDETNSSTNATDWQKLQNLTRLAELWAYAGDYWSDSSPKETRDIRTEIPDEAGKIRIVKERRDRVLKIARTFQVKGTDDEVIQKILTWDWSSF